MSAIIRLTVNGTIDYFKNRTIYVKQMSTEIASVLAADEKRISIPNDRYQYARNVTNDQILLRVDIKGSDSTATTSQILGDDLDQMTRNGLMSAVPEPHTAALDSIYGAPETRKLL